MDQGTKKADSETAHSRRLKALFCDKSGTDDYVGLSADNGSDEVFYVSSVVLAIAVKLDCDVVVMLQGVTIASLDAAADAQIDWEVQVGGVGFPEEFFGTIGGAIVYDDVVSFRY